MKKTLIVLATLTAANPALGVNYRAWTATELLQRWMVLNEDCRGGAADEPATMRACDERNLVDAALFADGYCYVGMGATSRWEKGPAPRWTRRGEQAICHR
ncbi:MAG TPA: hypothetical protein VGG77_07635 [Roseiarcus sp.]|jgi:hypothetical protein